jgi:hypothetical protein
MGTEKESLNVKKMITLLVWAGRIVNSTTNKYL